MGVTHSFFQCQMSGINGWFVDEVTPVLRLACVCCYAHHSMDENKFGTIPKFDQKKNL